MYLENWNKTILSQKYLSKLLACLLLCIVLLILYVIGNYFVHFMHEEVMIHSALWGGRADIFVGVGVPNLQRVKTATPPPILATNNL